MKLYHVKLYNANYILKRKYEEKNFLRKKICSPAYKQLQLQDLYIYIYMSFLQLL